MIFKESYLKSEKVKLDGSDDECVLYEINSLERAKVLDMTVADRKDDRFVGNLESNIYLICCSLKPGIEKFDFNKTSAELEKLPHRVLDKLASNAMKLSGFDEEPENKEGEGKGEGK